MIKTYFREDYLYWVKPLGKKKWKLAIYNKDKDEFILVVNRFGQKKETRYPVTKKISYIACSSLKTEMNLE